MIKCEICKKTKFFIKEDRDTENTKIIICCNCGNDSYISFDLEI